MLPSTLVPFLPFLESVLCGSLFRLVGACVCVRVLSDSLQVCFALRLSVMCMCECVNQVAVVGRLIIDFALS